jgi:hypothetical protein
MNSSAVKNVPRVAGMMEGWLKRMKSIIDVDEQVKNEN